MSTFISFQDANTLLQPHKMRLVDRADGCRGHYCIQRDRDSRCVEYWSGNRWSAFGMVYVDVEKALAQAAELIRRDLVLQCSKSSDEI